MQITFVLHNVVKNLKLGFSKSTVTYTALSSPAVFHKSITKNFKPSGSKLTTMKLKFHVDDRSVPVSSV